MTIVPAADPLTEIARRHLGLQTMAARNSDSLDFHEVAVWSLRAALEAAFELGRARGEAEPLP